MGFCNGICTSQLDDYCGMHSPEEICPACKAIWIQAHRENEEWNRRRDMNEQIV